MKAKILLFTIISTLTFTGCQNEDVSNETQALKQQIAALQQELTELREEKYATNNPTSNVNSETVSQNNTSNTTAEVTVNTLEQLSSMVDEYVASIGTVTPDVNNSGNLDQFFSLKRQGDEIEHAIENYENDLEAQYRAGSITRDDYRKMDRELERLEDLIDSACDRLEITFGIDD